MLLVASLLFGGMTLFTKIAGAHVPGGEIAAIRFAVGLTLTVAAAALGLVQLRVAPGTGLLLALRGLFGGVAVVLFFTAIARGAVGTATLLNFTSPVFTAFYAWLFLRERLSPWTALAFALAGGGVTLVWRGSAGDAPVSLWGWQLLGLGSAALAGGAITTMRALRRRASASSWTIFASFNTVGLLCTIPTATWGWVSPTPRDWGALLAVGVLSTAGQILFTHALTYVKAAVAGIIMQLTVVTAFTLGYLVLDEPVTWLAVGGAGLTLAGVTWAGWLSRTDEAPTPLVAAEAAPDVLEGHHHQEPEQ